MPAFAYKIMIVIATIIWGSTFVVMKDTVEVFEPSWLLGVRFLATSLVLGIVFWRKLRANLTLSTIRAGAVLGLLIFAAYWFQTVGLVYTTPGKNAFLTAIYCVIVPFLFWGIAKKRPTAYNIAAAVICIAGVGLVSLSGDALTIGFGDGMTIVCGFLFAAHIVATSIFAKTKDVVVLTVYQCFFTGLLGLLVGALTEPAPLLEAIGFDAIFNMAYLVIFGSCIAMGFQNAALAHVPPSQAAILLSLESVFGVLFSVLLYGEEVGLRLLCGFALIFVAVILSEAFPLKRGKDIAMDDGQDGREGSREMVDEAIAEDSFAN